MKTLFKYISVILLTAVISNSLYAQQNEVRIKILKKKDGKTEVIDTIIPMPGDSIMAFWRIPDFEKVNINTDSIVKQVEKQLKNINYEKVMREAEAHMRHVESQMREAEFHLHKMNDSIIEHRIKVMAPKLRKLDSLHRHQIEVRLKHLDSAHKKMMIIRPDSLPGFDFDIDLNMDSIIKKSHKSIRMLDSMDIHAYIPDMKELNESIREGLKEAHFFIMDDDFEWESEDNSDIEYIDGKVIKIKKDGNGKINKAIIMSPDGENIEVKEGLEAYKFVTEEGEEILIVTNIELKDINKAEKKTLKKKGLIDNGKHLPIEDIKIFPNPNDGTFRLTFSLENKDKTTIKIFNQSGKIVYSEELKNFTGSYDKEISLNSDLKSGAYFLQIIQKGKSITKKLLVE